jgi:hypothetical protein
MLKPTIAAWAAAALAGVALAGCPSLSALECQGASCDDGGTSGGGDAGPGGVRGLACGGGTTCQAPREECCISAQSVASCTTQGCNGGSDVYCDDPSQCGGAPCWLCNANGFQGTSCDFATDIVKNWGCSAGHEVYRLCHTSSQCDAGATCAPLPISVRGLDGGGATWFMACQ